MVCYSFYGVTGWNFKIILHATVNETVQYALVRVFGIVPEFRNLKVSVKILN